MVMFEGDPTRWAQAEAIEAFEGYLAKLAAGFWQDWWNDASEYARVARAIPPSVLIAAIERYRTNTTVLAKLFAIIEHGEIRACARLFLGRKQPRPPDHERHLSSQP
jgi:hypothetical protein